MRRTAPLIVGGGPAGTAAAITLARGGVPADLIERTTQAHDPVCGGFLGWDAIGALRKLGIDPWALGARRITHVRVLAGGRQAEAALPHPAAGLSRRTLDAALLAEAARLGVAISRGTTVRRIEGGEVHLADGAVLTPDSLFLATGKYELRGAARGSGKRARVGLRAAIPAQPDLAGWIELHLLDGGYAGLLVQDDGQANLCLSIASERLAAAGGSPERLIAALAEEAPRLAARMSAPATAWSAIAAVPYGWRTREAVPGRFRIGDQAAVIASLAGDGIAIALTSGRSAAEAWLAGGPEAASTFQRGFTRRSAWPIGAAETLRYASERPSLASPLLSLVGILPGSLGLAARLTRIGA
ncbi:NAD(P)/FAD-dependent oxidoreductase [Sphingomonas crusticola]|uniref:NAD(P)/FAD-dependent oxidoreductase n=1 Tax=Sphingomonas crusticola TaxID=1697973 RepID=UPI000E226F5A|nr:FAD-dependent monooxygenase [Sphingomonas crusticola]